MECWPQIKKIIIVSLIYFGLSKDDQPFKLEMSRGMIFPTMWHFDKCILKLTYAASF